MPDTGVPSGTMTTFDINERGRKLFGHLQPHVYPPGLITVSDVQLLEGMADFALSVPQGPGDDRNMMKLLAYRGQQPRGDEAPRRETKLGAPKNLS